MMQSQVSLQTMNTLQVACRAKYFTEISSTYQLLQLLETPEWTSEKHWILWGGSNTLFCSDFFDGIVLHIAIKGIKILEESSEHVRVQVGAGEVRDDFVSICREQKRGGVENLVAIPGNVGTSAVSNIGAYGQEASESIDEVIGIHLETKTIQKLSKEDCGFGYRKSIFKEDLQGKFIITHVIFKLKKIDEHYDFNTAYADIQNSFEAEGIDFAALSPEKKLLTLSSTIKQIRAKKLPDWTQVGTAGSYFKNPEIWLPQREALHSKFPELKGYLQDNEQMKLSAGQLIDLSGLKGYQEGKVKVSDQHALILINEGGSWEEIKRFAEKIQALVFEKFGVSLEPEVIYCD